MSNALNSKQLRNPRYWPSWCYIGILWLIAQLPLPVKLAIGRCLGLLLYYTAKERRLICETNIGLCFPHKNQTEQKALVKEIFIENGIGAIETAWAWWCNPKDIAHLADIEGLDILQKKQAEGRGVILLGAHYSTLDIGGLLVSTFTTIDVIYRRQKNPVIQYAMLNGRKRHSPYVIERSDTRQIVRRLKAGDTVWYAADQDYGLKHSVFAPFFGISAASITGTSRFARLSKSPIVLISHHRTKDNRYIIRFSEIENFPSGDDVTDATIINKALEGAIKLNPAQYLWLHRRFKTRPQGEASLYPKRKRKKRRKRNREIYRDNHE